MCSAFAVAAAVGCPPAANAAATPLFTSTPSFLDERGVTQRLSYITDLHLLGDAGTRVVFGGWSIAPGATDVGDREFWASDSSGANLRHLTPKSGPRSALVEHVSASSSQDGRYLAIQQGARPALTILDTSTDAWSSARYGAAATWRTGPRFEDGVGLVRDPAGPGLYLINSRYPPLRWSPGATSLVPVRVTVDGRRVVEHNRRSPLGASTPDVARVAPGGASYCRSLYRESDSGPRDAIGLLHAPTATLRYVRTNVLLQCGASMLSSNGSAVAAIGLTLKRNSESFDRTKLVVLRGRTLTTVDLGTGGPGSSAPTIVRAISPSGRFVLLAGPRKASGYALADVRTRSVRRVTGLPHTRPDYPIPRIVTAVWTPNERTIVYDVSGRLWAVDVASRKARPLRAPARKGTSPLTLPRPTLLSANGSHVLASYLVEPAESVALDGGPSFTLGTSFGTYGSIARSRDGNRSVLFRFEPPGGLTTDQPDDALASQQGLVVTGPTDPISTFRFPGG